MSQSAARKRPAASSIPEVEAARRALDEVERLADEGAASVDELCRRYLDAEGEGDDEDSAVRTLRELVGASVAPAQK